MSKPKIRKFIWADLASYAAIVRENRGEGAVFTAKDAEEYLRQPNLRPLRDAFVAEVDGRPVGYVLVVPEIGIGRAILEWGTSKVEGRETLVGALLQQGVKHAEKVGAKQAQTSAQGHDFETIALYEQADFRRIKTQWQMRLDVSRWKAEPLKKKRKLVMAHAKDGAEPIVTELQNKAFTGSWGFSPNVPEELAYRLRMKGSQVSDALLLKVDGTPAAYCWTRVNPSADGAVGIIWMIGVDPAYRGQGLGQVMLDKSVADLKKRGAKFVELTVIEDNKPAVELYLKVGFNKIYDIEWYGKEV